MITIRKSTLKKAGIAALALVMIAAAVFIIPPLSRGLSASHISFTQADEWNLILVNADNPIADDYEVELTVLSNGQSVDKRIYPELQRMFDDMRADGYSPEVVSGYRTAEKQESLLNDKIEAYRNEGVPAITARRLASQWVAKPGTSEHQLGMAVDINEKDTQQSSDEFYAWLNDNAAEYGFILRYPEEKSDITGISYEPWHFRYVGKEAAHEIYSDNLCLEEYLNNIN